MNVGKKPFRKRDGHEISFPKNLLSSPRSSKSVQKVANTLKGRDLDDLKVIVSPQNALICRELCWKSATSRVSHWLRLHLAEREQKGLLHNSYNGYFTKSSGRGHCDDLLQLAQSSSILHRKTRPFIRFSQCKDQPPRRLALRSPLQSKVAFFIKTGGSIEIQLQRAD